MTVKRVTPLSPRRGKGRPSRQAQLTIDAERSRFAAKKKLLDLQEPAVEELKKLLVETGVPHQTRLGAIRDILKLCDELYEELVYVEQEFEPESNEQPAEEEKPSFTVITAEFKG